MEIVEDKAILAWTLMEKITNGLETKSKLSLISCL